MRSFLLPILLAFSSAVAASEAHGTERPSFKDKELYSWRESGTGPWRFVLLNGTNRSKTPEEVLASGDKIASVEELKVRMAALTPGETVLWMIPDAAPFAAPSRNLVDEIAAFARSEFIDFAAPNATEITLAPMPHGQAINLVIAQKQDEIRAIDDGQMAWFDTKERSWSARRPVGPGVIDTTHNLVVTYSIDGVERASWHVDLRSGVVVRFEPHRSIHFNSSAISK
ncbi:hypothetical protein LVB77_01120 [Lysobacter sp. 5GHs7-4]|uniref:hypothetical protein n=1 Tax=Lysobacter sp. 5GHs7-4 TaxID=2904253 RepID=UPI001E358FC7|nr:hypothetical protein [Lysobacter sp. 5GHs7-4]UHQ23345.1 hypothetical protein LVB77_01120 [Lysobacter sp. 5GHs7-4]